MVTKAEHNRMMHSDNEPQGDVSELHELLSSDFDCSGIVLVDEKRACKHGFPYHPSCDHEPMKPGVYKNAPCMSEKTSAWLYPNTGKPEQLGR